MLSRVARKEASGNAESIKHEINETKSGLFGSTDCGLFKKNVIFL
jgi:hypothetical protein